MFKKICILAVITIIACHGNAQQYSIDSSFGSNGSIYPIISRELNAVVADSNGNYYTCGYIPEIGTFNYHCVVNKIKINGDIDSTFGIDGMASIAINLQDYAYDCALQGDGKIVVVGSHNNGNGPNPASNCFILRYKPNGILDSTFGTNGIRTLSYGTESGFAKVKILPDGKIVAAGNVFQNTKVNLLLAKFLSNGSNDMNFANNGISISSFTNNAGLWDIDVLNDGSIIASGNEGNYDPSPNPNFDIRLCMTKYQANGSLDSSFGTNGIFLHDMDSLYDDIIFNTHLQSDGKIICTGTGAQKGFIMRLLPMGQLDTTYDGDGILLANHVTRVSVLQQNDKLVTINSYNNAGAQDLKLIRYNIDASMDTSFGINSNINHNINGSTNYLHAAIIDAQENIITCGFSDSTSLMSKYKIATSMPSEVVINTKNNITIYPNPANEKINMLFESSGLKTIEIIDVTGRICETTTTDADKFSTDISKLQIGIYIIQVTSFKNMHRQKFMKN